MILVQTIGSVDMPGYGARKLPSPRQYLAIVVAWMVLFLAAGIGQQARRAAASLAWLLVVTGMVIGPFGKRLIALFGTIASGSHGGAFNPIDSAAAPVGAGVGSVVTTTPAAAGSSVVAGVASTTG